MVTILISFFLTLLDNSVLFSRLAVRRLRDGLSGACVSAGGLHLVFGALLLLGDLLARRSVFVARLSVFITARFLIGVASNRLVAHHGPRCRCCPARFPKGDLRNRDVSAVCGLASDFGAPSSVGGGLSPPEHPVDDGARHRNSASSGSFFESVVRGDSKDHPGPPPTSATHPPRSHTPPCWRPPTVAEDSTNIRSAMV